MVTCVNELNTAIIEHIHMGGDITDNLIQYRFLTNALAMKVDNLKTIVVDHEKRITNLENIITSLTTTNNNLITNSTTLEKMNSHLNIISKGLPTVTDAKYVAVDETGAILIFSSINKVSSFFEETTHLINQRIANATPVTIDSHIYKIYRISELC